MVEWRRTEGSRKMKKRSKRKVGNIGKRKSRRVFE